MRFPMTRAAAFAAAALLTASAGLTACGSSSKSASTQASTPSTTATTPAATPPASTTPATPKPSGASVDVALSEFKIKPAVTSVSAGRVTFTVNNTGQVKHQFTVISTTKSAATVLSKHNPNDDIAGARGEIAAIAPGATKTLVIKKLKPGHYAFVCALPGHYQSGMFADFTVK